MFSLHKFGIEILLAGLVVVVPVLVVAQCVLWYEFKKLASKVESLGNCKGASPPRNSKPEKGRKDAPAPLELEKRDDPKLLIQDQSVSREIERATTVSEKIIHEYENSKDLGSLRAKTGRDWFLLRLKSREFLIGNVDAKTVPLTIAERGALYFGVRNDRFNNNIYVFPYYGLTLYDEETVVKANIKQYYELPDCLESLEQYQITRPAVFEYIKAQDDYQLINKGIILSSGRENR